MRHILVSCDNQRSISTHSVRLLLPQEDPKCKYKGPYKAYVEKKFSKLLQELCSRKLLASFSGTRKNSAEITDNFNI